MPLPKIEYPLFDAEVPSTGQKIKMRPFLVKEEKLLLIAQTSADPTETVNAITQVVNNCIVSEDIDVDNLTTFDLEYLFIRLRAKSINNVIDILYTDSDDGEQYKVQVNLDDVEIRRSENHTNKIEIGKGMGIELSYPTAKVAQVTNNGMDEVSVYFNVLKHCLKSVWDEDNVYDMSDYSDEEVDEFLASLDVETFKGVQAFLESTPRIHYETSYTNNAGEKKKITLNNLNDFFTLG